MDKIFLSLLNRSIAAGWLILAVLALRLLLKKAPKWIPCLLWGIAAVRLVCPFSLESAFSLIPSKEILSPATVMYAQEPEIHSGIFALNSTLNPIIRESLAPAPGAAVNPLQAWMFLEESCGRPVWRFCFYTLWQASCASIGEFGNPCP